MPAAGYGFASHIGIVRENSFGVLAGARTDFIEALSESLTETRERFETRNVYGGFYEADDHAGLKRTEGDIVLTANGESVGFPLAGCLGVASTAEVASGELYTHTFTARTTDLENERYNDSYSIEVLRHDVTSAFHILGAVFNKVSLNVVPNQALQVTASVLAKSTDIGSASTPTFPGSPVDPFTFDTCSISWNGAANQAFEALTIDFDNQGEAIPVLNDSDEIYKIKRGVQAIRVSATLNFENLDEWNNFDTQATGRLFVHFTKANSFSMLIDVPSVRWTGFTANAGGRERITAALEGRGFYNAGSASAIEIQLTNTVSGYPLAANGL